jgi:hypothetical protein
MILFSSASPQWESGQFSQAWEHGVFTISNTYIPAHGQ